MPRTSKKKESQVVTKGKSKRGVVGVAIAAPTSDLGTSPAPVLKVDNKLGTLGIHRIGVVSLKREFVPVQGKDFFRVVTADGCSYLLNDEDFAAQYHEPTK